MKTTTTKQLMWFYLSLLLSAIPLQGESCVKTRYRSSHFPQQTASNMTTAKRERKLTKLPTACLLELVFGTTNLHDETSQSPLDRKTQLRPQH